MKTKWGKDFSLRVAISIQWSQKSNKMRAVKSNGFGGKVVVLGRLHLPLKIHCVSFSILLCAQKRLISHISSTAFPCPLASSWVWIIGVTEERERRTGGESAPVIDSPSLSSSRWSALSCVYRFHWFLSLQSPWVVVTFCLLLALWSSPSLVSYLPRPYKRSCS